MSSEIINPIDPARFALALEALPLDALHSKTAEIRNSIEHLRHSNAQMLPFADAGDPDCKDAMFENLSVIGRMNARVAMIRAEVEKRGQRWSEGEVEDKREGAVEMMTDMTTTNGEHELVNGTVGASATTNGAPAAQPRAPSDRLTDDELRRQLEARIGGGGDAAEEEEDDDGVHL
ncbi:hypothetical protein LTR36_001088 [Oleoguttula mirabilis]|uniref:Uncharacterized protein n=1 Tax=Oleoguttula mirabilis TaxID=1507867 RepID=A0AAV9JPV0_9PEZI|nr:hypothetical protein LTR36_001088 [Oleoguttula mirabilis]